MELKNYLAVAKKTVLLGLTGVLVLSYGPTYRINTASAYSLTTPDEQNAVRQFVRELNFTFAIHSAAGTDINNPKLDVQQENLAIDITLDKKINSFYKLMNTNVGNQQGFDLGKRGVFIQFGFSGSIAPTVVRSQVTNEASAEVTEQVKEVADKMAQKKKEELYSQIPFLIEQDLIHKITEAVNSNPKFAMLTDSQREALIQQQVQINLPKAIEVGTPIVKGKIDTKVEQGKQAALPGAIKNAVNDHVTSRADALQLETSFQRLNVTMAVPLNLNLSSEIKPAIIVLSFGKDTPQMGGSLNVNGLTDWENLIGHATTSERGNTVAATGYASLGVAYDVGDGFRVFVNVIGYHDRDLWLTAQQYLQHAFQISTQDFDKNQDVTALDSIAANIKTYFNLKDFKGTFWGTVVKRTDPTIDQKANGFSFGGTVMYTPTKTTFNVAYANSGKAYYNKTWGVGIAQTIFEKQQGTYRPGLLIFADYRGVEFKDEKAVHGDQAGQKQLIAFGFKSNLCDFMYKGFSVDCSLTAEYQKGVKSEGNRFEGVKDDDIFAGITTNIIY